MTAPFARALAKGGSENCLFLEIGGVDVSWAYSLTDRNILIEKTGQINAAVASRVKAAVEAEREAAIKACDNEFVDDEDGLNKEDVAYNAGVRDCIEAVKSTAERRGGK